MDEYNYNENNQTNIENKPKKKRRFTSYFFTALIAALIGGMIGGYIFPVYIMGKLVDVPDYITPKETIPKEVNEINITTNNEVYYATAVAEKATDSVVGIIVTETYTDFWGEKQVEGMGSGVIVDPNGYILTNSHVIGDGQAEKITVLLDDKEQLEGEVLWYDTLLDLAVVKIDKEGLTAAELGNSDELKIGEPVVAIGNPLSLSLDKTVTSGIISGLNRSLQVDVNTIIEPLIQTDASINPGNSGGPLLNSKGEVIGINTAKMTSAEGLGFSIPINTAIPLLEQVINFGEVSSVYVGITGIDVQGYEERIGVVLSAEYGVYIVEVIKNSPASEADIQAGDVIQKIDGEEIETMNDLKRKLYNYKDGDSMEVTIYRDGDTITKEVVLRKRPNNF